jgi:hypothetical protein
MNIAASFSLSFETKVINPVGESQTTEGDAHSTSLQSVATWNLQTTQPNTLFPTYDEVVNLTGLLQTKGMSISSGK